jgi:hypothetical protein
MIRFTDGLHTLAVTAWVGALWAIVVAGLLASFVVAFLSLRRRSSSP